jgi:hypothetical protein
MTVEYLSGVCLPWVNREHWKSGEWDNEPDILRWLDAVTNLPCVARRGPSGHWCGYVGVAKDHPSYGKGYDDVDVEVHGGLTYAEACDEVQDGVCHLPEGADDVRWWFGFDCAHLGDESPRRDGIRFHEYHEVYRTLDYVKGECSHLALQLSAL